MQKIISVVAFALISISAKAQFRIETRPDFDKLTHDDSVFIYDASYEVDVKRCFVFKLNNTDMIITYKTNEYELVLMTRDYHVYQACEFRKEEFIIYENDKE